MLGESGGAPYAAACGALLASRVLAVGLLNGVAPLDVPGLSSALSGPLKVMFWLARAAPPLLRVLFKLNLRAMQGAVNAARSGWPRRFRSPIARSSNAPKSGTASCPVSRKPVVMASGAPCGTAASSLVPGGSTFRRSTSRLCCGRGSKKEGSQCARSPWPVPCACHPRTAGRRFIRTKPISHCRSITSGKFSATWQRQPLRRVDAHAIRERSV